MRADPGTLLHHDDAEIGIELLQPDRRGKARRPGADDHDVEFHGFARRKFFCTHDLISAQLRTALKARCLRFLRGGQPWKCNARRFTPARSETPRRGWCLPTAIPRRASCSSAKRPGATRTSRACRSSDAPENCWIG